MWKFQDFSVIQILREINCGQSRSSKTVFCHFWPLSFCIWVNFIPKKSKKSKSIASRVGKITDFAF